MHSLVQSVPVTEDTPADMLAGSMDLAVELPSGAVVRSSVQRATPMLDLLVQLCTAHRLAPGSHRLQPQGERGPLPFKPSTPIGLLDALSVRILPKNSNNNNNNNTNNINNSNQPFQHTFRLQVHLPRNQLLVARVSPQMSLSAVLQLACQEKSLDMSKYELRHPGNVEERLRGDLRLCDYGGLTEVVVVARGEAGAEQLAVLREQERRRRRRAARGGHGADHGGRLGKQSSSTEVSGGSGSGGSLTSSGGSTGARSSSPEAVPPPSAAPRPPARKRRPAPPPPAGLQTPAVTHSRTSSDSSGYHEASVLSDSPDGNNNNNNNNINSAALGQLAAPVPGNSSTLPRRSKLPPATDVRPQPLSRSLSNINNAPQGSLASAGRAPPRKKRPAPPPPPPPTSRPPSYVADVPEPARFRHDRVGGPASRPASQEVPRTVTVTSDPTPPQPQTKAQPVVREDSLVSNASSTSSNEAASAVRPARSKDKARTQQQQQQQQRQPPQGQVSNAGDRQPDVVAAVVPPVNIKLIARNFDCPKPFYSSAKQATAPPPPADVVSCSRGVVAAGATRHPDVAASPAGGTRPRPTELSSTVENKTFGQNSCVTKGRKDGLAVPVRPVVANVAKNSVATEDKGKVKQLQSIFQSRSSSSDSDFAVDQTSAEKEVNRSGTEIDISASKCSTVNQAQSSNPILSGFTISTKTSSRNCENVLINKTEREMQIQAHKDIDTLQSPAYSPLPFRKESVTPYSETKTFTNGASAKSERTFFSSSPMILAKKSSIECAERNCEASQNKISSSSTITKETGTAHSQKNSISPSSGKKSILRRANSSPPPKKVTIAKCSSSSLTTVLDPDSVDKDITPPLSTKKPHKSLLFRNKKNTVRKSPSGEAATGDVSSKAPVKKSLRNSIANFFGLKLGKDPPGLRRQSAIKRPVPAQTPQDSTESRKNSVESVWSSNSTIPSPVSTPSGSFSFRWSVGRENRRDSADSAANSECDDTADLSDTLPHRSATSSFEDENDSGVKFLKEVSVDDSYPCQTPRKLAVMGNSSLETLVSSPSQSSVPSAPRSGRRIPVHLNKIASSSVEESAGDSRQSSFDGDSFPPTVPGVETGRLRAVAPGVGQLKQNVALNPATKSSARSGMIIKPLDDFTERRMSGSSDDCLSDSRRSSIEAGAHVERVGAAVTGSSYVSSSKGTEPPLSTLPARMDVNEKSVDCTKDVDHCRITKGHVKRLANETFGFISESPPRRGSGFGIRGLGKSSSLDSRSSSFEGDICSGDDKTSRISVGRPLNRTPDVNIGKGPSGPGVSCEVTNRGLPLKFTNDPFAASTTTMNTGSLEGSTVISKGSIPGSFTNEAEFLASAVCETTENAGGKRLLKVPEAIGSPASTAGGPADNFGVRCGVASLSVAGGSTGSNSLRESFNQHLAKRDSFTQRLLAAATAREEEDSCSSDDDLGAVPWDGGGRCSPSPPPPPLPASSPPPLPPTDEKIIGVLTPPTANLVDRGESVESWSKFLQQLDDILERHAEFV